jgi:tetratricopeptide (TPR) repeat protein
LLLGRPAEAAEQAAAVADAQPGNPAAQALLADTLLASGRTAEAIASYRAALATDPFLGRAHKGLGDALVASGQPADALAEYDAAIRRNPADADALSNRGKVRLAVGNAAAARADFTTALAVRPDAEAELQLGTLTLKEGKPAEALPHFERASQLKPGDARMENNCGAALLALGRPEDAERRFRAALSADPNHAKAHAALGQVLMGRGLAADAIAHFRTAIALKNDGPATLSALAWLLATAADPKLRDGAEAVRLAEQACRQTGGRDPSCLDALSVSYACIGRFDDAVRTARAAADIADATGAAQQAALIRRRISALEAGRPPYP